MRDAGPQLAKGAPATPVEPHRLAEDLIRESRDER
jgi:hypothetical protein